MVIKSNIRHQNKYNTKNKKKSKKVKISLKIVKMKIKHLKNIQYGEL